MIVYALKCADGHPFDAWFRSGADCDGQLAAGQVACPVCGGVQVGKAPMAPRINRGRVETPHRADVAPSPGAASITPAGAPVAALEGDAINTGRDIAGAAPVSAPPTDDPNAVALRQMLRDLRRQVEANATNVGRRFAQEARKIHYGEAESRPIYGEASREEAEDLREEGIAVTRLPWLEPEN